MKIGILTYHRLANRGSVLQAYALQKRLATDLPGASVEIVDYSSFKMELLPVWRFVRNRAPIPFDPHEVAETRRMRRFVRGNLTLSSRSLRTDSTQRAMRWLQQQGYDAVIVGSDVVWEIQPRSYSVGGVTPYHLPGEAPFLKLSFAVSMDPVVDYPQRLRDKLSQMAEHVARFDFISVRDEATRGVLVAHGVDPARIRYMPDPTLLFDLNELVGTSPWKRGDRPVIAVDLPGRLARPAHAAGRRAGFEVWDWRHNSGDAVDRAVPLGLDVGDLLALYAHVDLLVTDRFHGAILASKIGGAGVVFVEHDRKWPLANSKGRDLFRRAGVEGCVERVEGGDLSPSAMAGGIQRATAEAETLRQGLARLAEGEGEAALAELRQVLAGPPSG